MSTETKPRPRLTAEAIYDAFKAIEAAALSGERCPKTWSPEVTDGVLPSGATGALTRDGRIRIDIYPHNWRVATILVGEHAGKHTALPPNKSWRPYRTIGAALPGARP